MDATPGASRPVGGAPRRWSGACATHAWDRFDGLWAALFYVTLGFPTVSSLLTDAATASERLVVVAGVGTVAGGRELAVRWVLRHLPEGADVRFAPGDRHHRWVCLAWAVATVAGLAVLVRAHPLYFFALYGLFPQAFTILPRNWAIAFAGGLTPAVLLSEGGASVFEDRGFFVTAIGSTLVALVLGLFIHAIGKESQERHQAILALEAAQAETASLQRQLVEAARSAGVVEERARLAREIHDTLAQGFVSVLTQLEAVDASALPSGVAVRLDQVRHIARASLDEARRSVQALRPGELEAASLPEAVVRVARRWSVEAGVGAAVTVTGCARGLPPATEVTLVRAVQESLANVSRHARATSVHVTLSFLDDAVVLDVDDDGRGFETSAASAGPDTGGGGFGLVALRQRVDAAGGTVDIETGPGAGTTLTVRLPLAGLEAAR